MQILNILILCFSLLGVFLSYKIYEEIPFRKLLWLVFGFAVLSILRLLHVLNDFSIILVNIAFINGCRSLSIFLILLGLFFIYRAIIEYKNGK